MLSEVEKIKEDFDGKIDARKRADIEHNRIFSRRNDYKKIR
jgi:hypothetical protein